MKTILNKKFVKLAVVFFIIGCLAGAGTIYALVPTLSYSTYIEEASMNIGFSYVFSRDGSTYFARDGFSGAVTYGTNITTLAQTAINVYGSGAYLFKEAQYEWSGTLTIYDHTSLIGEVKGREEEENGARFKLTADIPYIIQSNNTVDSWGQQVGVTIENIDFFGDGLGARTSGSGMHLIGCSFLTIKNTRFIQFPDNGFVLRKCHFVVIEALQSSGHGGADPYSIGVDYGDYAYLGENSHVTRLSGGACINGNGIVLDGTWSTIFSYLQYDDNNQNGIYLDGGDRNTFIHTRAAVNGLHGIFGVITHTTFLGGELFNNGVNNNASDGMRLYNAHNNTIISMYAWDTQHLGYSTQRYPFSEGGSSNGNHFIHNTVGIGNLNNIISIVGADTICVDNRDFVTENMGSSTGTGAEQTIPHGLTDTPDFVFWGNVEDGANPYLSSASDGTNIYVTAVNTLDYVWYAVHEP